MTYRALATLPLCVLLCQCQPAPKSQDAPPVTSQAAAPASPYGFDVVLTLSPAAKAKLERMHEQVTVSAMYFGMPGPGHEKDADEMGQINLGNIDTNVVPSATLVHVSGALDAKPLAMIKDEPQVLINVYTARLAHEDNLLDCGIFEDTVTKARTAPIAISCKLIYPDPEQGGAL